jgi:hypothetical protein
VPPPEGFATWDDYWHHVGVGEAELGLSQACIIDPDGSGPRIWFQVLPDSTTTGFLLSQHARHAGPDRGPRLATGRD